MRQEWDAVTAGPDTTIGARCDGSKIELTSAHQGLFVALEITPLRAVSLARELLAFAEQMLSKPTA